ncbi:MAG: hypothetical protein U0166_29125 [Acidobacteriota bacterium]
MGMMDQLFKPKSERDYQRLMSEGKFDKALAIAEEFRMDSSRIVEAAKGWMEAEWQKGDFERAAQIGVQYRLSKKRTHDAADKALDAAIKARNIDKAQQLIGQYELDRRKLLVEGEKMYQHEMDSEAFRAAAEIARQVGLDNERVEKAVSRAFKKALREKDDATIAELSTSFADHDLDWERVKAATINLMVHHLKGQVYGKAIEISERYQLTLVDCERALDQAATERFKYMETLRSSLVVKPGEVIPEVPEIPLIREELRAGFQREIDKRASSIVSSS